MTEHQVKCGQCSSPMELRIGRFGKFYGCVTYPACRATHGAHPDGSPMGVPADKETSRWRVRAHGEFDRLWREGFCKSRTEAYIWMRTAMGMSSDEAHIGNFSIKECQRLIEVVVEKRCAVITYMSIDFKGRQKDARNEKKKRRKRTRRSSAKRRCE